MKKFEDLVLDNGDLDFDAGYIGGSKEAQEAYYREEDEMVASLDNNTEETKKEDSQKATPLKINKEDSDVVTNRRLLNKKGPLTSNEVDILIGEK